MNGAVLVLLAGIVAFLQHPAPDRVVLLPAPDGSVGKVIVSTAGGEKEIAQAYATAAVTPGGGVQSGSAAETEVATRYADVLQARPRRPASYLLYFQNDSDQLTDASQATLEALKQDVASRPVPEILVIGHTDLVGSSDYNDNLSLQRAQVIAGMLQQLGVQPKSLEVTGRGMREPLVPTANGVEEPRNRRVEVSVR
ncbi:OmpA family protein [Vogesella sp. LIG4]|uniref:OmpA family protein n=1 Tax=Vogesella sp. LIG4 TaxID=1192162 RepID=UPI00081FFE75|nr:OmpA family protein [Vogesella sp. LIG4]SCK22982.1 Outer membrane protein OmpA [Vogesella sp. LIG4]